MTDKEKLDAITEEIHRLVNVRGYDRRMANDLFTFIDSLPNEPISEDLEEAAIQFATDTETGKVDVVKQSSFFWGAIYNKQQMMKGSIDGEIQFGTIKLQKEDIKEAVKSLREGDKVKLIVIKNNRI